MLTLNSHFICEIINDKFHYEHKDWFTGEKNAISSGNMLKSMGRKQNSKNYFK